MDDTERYRDSFVYRSRSASEDNKAYVNCRRQRCTNICNLQRESNIEQEGKPYITSWRYDESVVVVSLEDGTKKHPFCSRRCAALWLNSQET